MRSLLAFLVVVSAVASSACGGPPPTTASPPASSPARAASIVPTGPPPSPSASAEPVALVSVETRGGECPNGACGSVVVIESDGRLHQLQPTDAVIGQIPTELLEALEALRVEIDQADFALIESRPFTGTCPTAYDGQETIYTFHVASGDEAIASCKVAIDENHPLFRAVSAVLALATP